MDWSGLDNGGKPSNLTLLLSWQAFLKSKAKLPIVCLEQLLKFCQEVNPSMLNYRKFTSDKKRTAFWAKIQGTANWVGEERLDWNIQTNANEKNLSLKMSCNIPTLCLLFRPLGCEWMHFVAPKNSACIPWHAFPPRHIARHFVGAVYPLFSCLKYLLLKLRAMKYFTPLAELRKWKTCVLRKRNCVNRPFKDAANARGDGLQHHRITG